ncbi:2-oxoglutarate dehydrogenase E1 component [Methylobacterium oryzihabitans]|uniref:2-oxoglutarate dehydrogenase E1 component n=1 Tax=Methylobacterium oryzihabitans TaxID=2499852 RepID=A0A3S2VCG6_9HYPH|nr:2-oxoglutarate dehydrogenase E1 component [Methylobacterium oryzihabitans]RVU21213.1 2-oxoglutarate dehydrogenase E1 component [Methylobacterium oryzihabitans]
MRSSPLSSVSYAYLDAMQRAFDADPQSVEPGWRVVFEVLAETGSPGADLRTGQDALWRDRGHLQAQLDPLAPRTATHDPLQAVYAGTLAIESAHIDDESRRSWLRSAVETGAGLPAPETPHRLLADLIAAEEFEAFLAKKFPTKKRFGAEGAEAIVPLLRRVLTRAANEGVTRAIIGTMHRGRLSLMHNVLGRPFARLIAEIKGAHPFPADAARPADVPYHLGYETELMLDGRTISVSLLANPSHLEAVDPVVLGRARAAQDEAGDARTVLPIIIHTDAAVIGQGLVAECIQLGGPAGYSVGGTVHLIVNNQIGFTTPQQEARTSRYCTGSWKAVDSVILHVNGDDPAAVAKSADIAVAWRQVQGCDAVVDLVCYRRNGHNEIDEPAFTQPTLYARIAEHPPVAQGFAQQEIRAGRLTQAEVTAMRDAARARLQAGYDEAPGYPIEADRRRPRPTSRPTDVGVSAGTLQTLSDLLAAAPAGMTLHPRMGRVLKQRLIDAAGVPWPSAESLAVGSLLRDGVAVRLSGQDVVRGAFSHRHFALADYDTGVTHTSLAHIGAQPSFEAFNSPLSEYAVLGFEYGYSLERSDALVIWEAQFGDFANGAQIMIDQFVVAAEAKWCNPSRLVMLLPHGLEGQGPEHSSARLERYLQLAADNNIRIVNPSTPANYFHLLRAQGLGRYTCPLIVMAAKKLLRLPAALSPVTDFQPGSAFEPVISSVPDGPIDTVLMCSGKIAYDLEEERARRNATTVAILRLECLYPLPSEQIGALLQRWPDARLVWVQEEPRNMGAWNWLDRRLEAIATDVACKQPTFAYVGRPESASPAGSFHGNHDADQRMIAAYAFSLSAGAGSKAKRQAA